MAFASGADLEAWALGELRALGHVFMPGAAADPESAAPLRQSYRDTILLPNLTAAIRRLNPALPDEAVRSVANALRDTVFAGDLIQENRRIHEALVGGVKVTWLDRGEERSDLARLVDWENCKNEWLVISQLEVAGKSVRRPDIVIFLNGLPIVVVELKAEGHRERHPERGLQPDRDLQGANPGPVPHQCFLGDLRRGDGALRLGVGRLRPFHALADCGW
ncbi:MAG: type I restriction endonuclease [Paracoccaceae bacterium]